MESIEQQDAPIVESSATAENAPAEVAQEVVSEVSSASQDAPEKSSPETKTGKDEILEIVNEAIKPVESETKAEEAAPKQDEPEAEVKAEEKDPNALSQEQAIKVPNEQRPEWQKLVGIGDKLGKQAGKEVRETLREIYRKEARYVDQIEKSKPAVEVYQEIHQSVGGNPTGISNIRQLIKDCTDNHDATIAPLGMLLEDSVNRSTKAPSADAIAKVEKILSTMKERAGLVITNPDRLRESSELDQQVRDNLITPEQAAKRKSELLALEKADAIARQSGRESEKTQSQLQAERDRQQRTQNEAQTQRAVTEINQAEASWSESKSKSDPDFAAVQVLHSAFAKDNSLNFWNENKRLPSAKESVEILEKSLKMAKAEAAKFAPKPKAKTVVNGNGNGSSAQHRQQPKNAREQIEADIQDALSRQ